MNKAQIFEFFRRLAEDNPSPQTELEYGNAYQLLVAVALSAQATDVGVNKATRGLFRKVDTPQAMLDRAVQRDEALGPAAREAGPLVHPAGIGDVRAVQPVLHVGKHVGQDAVDAVAARQADRAHGAGLRHGRKRGQQATGGGVERLVGVDGAAHFYFNKSARDVTLAEAAMLAGAVEAERIARRIGQPRLAQAFDHQLAQTGGDQRSREAQRVRQRTDLRGEVGIVLGGRPDREDQVMRIDRRAPAISNWNNMRARVARPADGVPVTTIASVPTAGWLPSARQWAKDPGSVSSWPVLSSQFSAKAACTDVTMVPSSLTMVSRHGGWTSEVTGSGP